VVRWSKTNNFPLPRYFQRFLHAWFAHASMFPHLSQKWVTELRSSLDFAASSFLILRLLRGVATSIRYDLLMRVALRRCSTVTKRDAR
jgi:hypothetical protein